ncbi:glutamate racemase [Anaerotignum neopropionicum]|uniref:Glutamate racemase n=1 Tax=Anaerotignum neopropionicum TaxID=36847 RepID=A0A136WHP2_9FIRM|nr:glutamate racemase [Anaerotignum neopropionicum]KXL54088.1 glutamate racemase [Anaerotignum neopropionicum]
MDKRPIGIFDSGVGGLTVVKQVMKVMPHENIVYFGDTARLPYGSKSKEAVTKFSKQNVRFLLTKEVKAIIVACNTASSNSLEELHKAFDVPIFGVVDAGVAEALRTTQNKKIGVIGTAGTVRSRAYEKMILRQEATMEVFSKACPLFVPLAEEGWTENEVARLTAENYLEGLLAKGIDSLVLGCTHYPLLKRCIGTVVGENVKLVDPAKATAKQVKLFLQEKGITNLEEKTGERTFYLSDYTDMFYSICQKALKQGYHPEIMDIEQF